MDQRASDLETHGPVHVAQLCEERGKAIIQNLTQTPAVLASEHPRSPSHFANANAIGKRRQVIGQFLPQECAHGRSARHTQ